MLWLPVILALLLAAASWKGERARAAHYRKYAGRSLRPLTEPPVTVIVPVKGPDEGLRENLAALAALDYPDFELIVAARSLQDMPPDVVPGKARLVLAGAPEGEQSEKIRNLLEAVRQARPESAVLAFADSDGRPDRGWLRALVAALEQPDAGAATGYRWHLPEGGFSSLLRSGWNAVIAGNMGPGDNRFAWGGAMAIRRETFARARIEDYWREAVSDDYRLSEAVHALGLRVVFAPGALVATADRTGFAELLGWVRRQLRITRFYAPKLWALALVSHVLYCSGMAAAVWLAARGSWLAAAAFFLQIGIGMGKAVWRLQLARLVMPGYESWFRRWGWVHVLLTPLATWLWLYASAAAGFSNRIQWRGYCYRLRRLGKPGRAPEL